MSDLMTYVTKHRGWMISISWVMLLSLFSNVKVVFILVAVLLAFLIFTFAKLHHTGEIINYIEMIRCTSLVYVFHTLYILILVWLKHESIADECQVVTKIVRKEFD